MQLNFDLMNIFLHKISSHDDDMAHSIYLCNRHSTTSQRQRCGCLKRHGKSYPGDKKRPDLKFHTGSSKPFVQYRFRMSVFYHVVGRNFGLPIGC
jgi:hypothetical protein